ncbi:MAG: lipid-A-disaccharide synthase [Candidatus Omnitrophota bacterium]
MEEKKILIICGEASGDLHAANLAKAIKKINPSVKISAVGGKQLQAAKADIIYDIKELSVIGLLDVLKKLPRFISLKNFLIKKIIKEKYDLLIMVDFSGFNLRLAKTLNKRTRLVYYISPQVWASREGRINIIKKYIDKMVVLFEFEERFYREHGIKASFIGHPLLDIVKSTLSRNEFLKGLGLTQDKITIALLPGSRNQEIKNIFPIMLKSAAIIKQNMENVQFLLVKSPQLDYDVYNSCLQDFLHLNIKISEAGTYDCINAADFCLVCSGTATLETTILQKPFVVIYKLGLLNYLLYRPQIKVPFIGITNIISGKKIVPEFIQFKAKPRSIAELTLKLLRDTKELERMKEDLTEAKEKLGKPGACDRAAEIINEYLK